MDLDTTDYTVWVFDLDDTLYPETQYISQAYTEIAQKIARRSDHDEQEMANFLLDEFRLGKRHALFDRFLNQFHLDVSVKQEMLHLLRTIKVTEPLVLYPGMKQLLNTLIIQKKQRYIITNGNVEQQKNKVEQLGIESLFDGIIYANEFSPKPNTASWEVLSTKFQLKRSDAVYIGDSESDRTFADRCKIAFIEATTFLK
jgi:HAD superfamily hydrolase (TIGR01509 family)